MARKTFEVNVPGHSGQGQQNAQNSSASNGSSRQPNANGAPTNPSRPTSLADENKAPKRTDTGTGSKQSSPSKKASPSKSPSPSKGALETPSRPAKWMKIVASFEMVFSVFVLLCTIGGTINYGPCTIDFHAVTFASGAIGIASGIVGTQAAADTENRCRVLSHLALSITSSMGFVVATAFFALWCWYANNLISADAATAAPNSAGGEVNPVAPQAADQGTTAVVAQGSSGNCRLVYVGDPWLQKQVFAAHLIGAILTICGSLLAHCSAALAGYFALKNHRRKSHEIAIHS